jgi:hypothetical protein
VATRCSPTRSGCSAPRSVPQQAQGRQRQTGNAQPSVVTDHGADDHRRVEGDASETGRPGPAPPHPGLPLKGLRINGGAVGAVKSNTVSRAPARSSNEWSPMRPVRQLSSMNRSIEV